MERINVLIQFVNDARPERQAEYDECVRRNLANPHVKMVHNLEEHERVRVPEEFRAHPKFRTVKLGRWMTYKDVFDYASANLAEQTCCLVNLDIFLDPASDWAVAADAAARKIVFCLSRTEYSDDGSTYRDPELLDSAFAVSQDAWLFQSPMAVHDCDFRVGTMGCDNAIAHRIKQAGYVPVNAAQRFRVFHYDRFRGKTLNNQHEIYARERGGKEVRTYPEREGQYLLPDVDMARSVDKILESLKVSELDRYVVVCDVLNRLVKVNNP